MSMKSFVSMLVVLVGIPCMLAAQDQAPAKTIQHTPIKSTSAASGKEMFNSYCAVCHGTDGKGGGPAASALKAPPSDLTLLSKENGAKFPSLKVTSILRGTSDLPAHGSKEMPMWGPLFRSISGGHESEVQQRTANLSRYLETMQAK
jgi:mono/diheme cytochrome c family protein